MKTPKILHWNIYKTVVFFSRFSDDDKWMKKLYLTDIAGDYVLTLDIIIYTYEKKDNSREAKLALEIRNRTNSRFEVFFLPIVYNEKESWENEN